MNKKIIIKKQVTSKKKGYFLKILKNLFSFFSPCTWQFCYYSHSATIVVQLQHIL